MHSKVYIVSLLAVINVRRSIRLALNMTQDVPLELAAPSMTISFGVSLLDRYATKKGGTYRLIQQDPVGTAGSTQAVKSLSTEYFSNSERRSQSQDLPYHEFVFSKDRDDTPTEEVYKIRNDEEGKVQ